MTSVLYRLGGACVRHRWIVLAVWLVVFLALAGWARSVGTNVNDNLTLPGSNSQRATNVLDAHFASQANGVIPVAMLAPSGAKITDSRFAKPIADTVKALKADPGVRGATSPLSTQGKSLLDKDKTIGYIALRLRLSPNQLTLDDANRIVDAAQPAKAAGLKPAFGGYLGQKVSKPETHSSEVIGIGMAILVLLFTFGTAVAMALPITTAILGLVCGLSIVTLLSHVAEVPTVAPTLATMIGLGVGIDYALFIVTRHQAQRRGGMETRESIARAVATSGGAILFAGGTVIIALLSLAVVGIPLVTTLGYTSALVVAVAVTGAITMLPALLAVVGDGIDRLALPHHDHAADDHPHGWARWGRAVAARPWPCLVSAVVILALLALPVLDLTLGQQDNGALPTDTNSRQSYDLMTKGFGVGSNGALLISVNLTQKPAKADQSNLDKLSSSEKSDKQKANKQADAKQSQLAQQLEAEGLPPDQADQQAAAQVKPQRDKQLKKISQSSDAKRKQLDQTATDPRLQTLRNDIKKAPDVHSVTEPLVNGKGTAAVLTVTPSSAPSDQSTEQLVRTLRDTTIPKATKGASMTAAVGGTTAGYVDLADEISSRLVLTIAVVVALSFFLLLIAFRSIVIPLTAGLMNLISIGAAFGVVTAVFEKGWGASVIGLDGEVPIVSYVPLMMFAILFGLSMDYEVFLMTHIRERWLRLHDNKQAVIDGVANTGRVITSAALIMVSVFFAFVINGDPTVKQFGVGMGVAVAVDATLVRCLLVPAVMVVIGKANWWFPRWLEWVPNLSIEGDDWFAERDRAAKEREAEEAVHA
jgi:putative drug exporter of the RND superfamily